MSTIENMVPSIYEVGMVHRKTMSHTNYVTDSNISKKNKIFI